MIYWLYTSARPILTGLLLPLLVLTLILPLLTASVLGRGIQRKNRASPQPIANGWRWAFLLSSYLAVNSLTIAALVSLTAGYAIRRGGKPVAGQVARVIIGGGAGVDGNRLYGFGLLMLLCCFTVSFALRGGLQNGGWLRERVDRWRRPHVPRGAMGSAHFCTAREYRRFRKSSREGITLYGAFWGQQRRRLDLGVGRFCLNGEDAARGILTLGGPGSGKTQGVILPVIADRMLAGHSLIIADPQGELTSHILKFAGVTGHLVVVHDPTSSTGPRYNLSQGIANVSDARAIADVLIPSAEGEHRFWTDSAAALLAACLIRFHNLGEIYGALSDTKALSRKLAAGKDDAALLATSFTASVTTDGRVASNIVATLATALTGWASVDVRANTNTSDFSADLLVERPTVIVLTCPGRMRAVYASYLGATLRKLMLDLDTIGERQGGPLPLPVGIILDEFPTLGKLDSLVADVNLVRKRRISILIAAQTKGQFHRLYGQDGTQALLTGLATQIIYGGCDADTAEFYSKASGTTSADTDPAPEKASYRSRPLLTLDEVITPRDGNCTIFARYVEPAFATQVVLTAQLTRLYERLDWTARFKTGNATPFILKRRTDLEPLDQTSSVAESTVQETGTPHLDTDRYRATWKRAVKGHRNHESPRNDLRHR
jgi:type IV secretory pathway TraG/TraD family ATPase VirD4